MGERYHEEQIFENLELENETVERSQFVDCKFINCRFERCKLIKCMFSGCEFQDCTVADLEPEYSQMKYTEFINCSLTGIDWSALLPNGKFAEPISKLKDCRLKYNTFTEMNLKKFDFTGTAVLRSIFAKCELSEGNFRNCKLDETEFFQCDIRKADFRGAAGFKIDLASNKLKGAQFSYPDVMSLLDGLEIKIE